MPFLVISMCDGAYGKLLDSSFWGERVYSLSRILCRKHCWLRCVTAPRFDFVFSELLLVQTWMGSARFGRSNRFVARFYRRPEGEML